MSTKRYVEFQAVVLAGGKGSRMVELSKGKPKCLLPIQNKPMIWYPLRLLEKTGFSDVIVVVPQSSKAEIISVVSELGLKIKIDWSALPENASTAEEPGTADAIRHIYSKITTDLVIVSCDLIMDVDVNKFLNVFRLHEASLVAMFFPQPNISPKELNLPGPKKSWNVEKDFVGIDSSASNRLVSFASTCDFKENFEIQRKVIRKHPNFILNTNLLDAHFYVIRKSIVDYLNYKKNIITIKGDLVPTIVKKQMTKRPKPIIVNSSLYDDTERTTLDEEECLDEIYKFVKEDPIESWIMQTSPWSDHEYSTVDPYYGDIIRCYAYLNQTDRALRVNDMHLYKYANFTELPVKHDQEKISPSATIKGTQIQDTFVGDNALIEEKTSLTNSRIGANSKVMPKTRVLNSIIMDNVTISEKCVIDNCIIANDCFIEEGTTLKNCILSSKQRVLKDSDFDREYFEDAKKMMEI